MTSHKHRLPARLARNAVTLLVLAGAGAGLVALSHAHGVRPHLAPPSPSPARAASPAADIDAAKELSAGPATPATQPATHRPVAQQNMCRANSDAQRVIVSIGQQRAWMCAGPRQVYTSATTTGASSIGNGTPTGTWHVLAKETNRWLSTLDGSSYHVDYWVPYDGSYGFHDSTWQKFAYGSPQYRTEGSHGCVHLPMNAMAWLFNWAQVGATVTIAA